LIRVLPRTAAAINAMLVENRYIATIKSPCTGTQPKTLLGGNNAPMIRV
jgi:hypothetical protein